MARARTPLMRAMATGRVLHDPKRFAKRKEPVVKEPLGDPPKWLKKASEREAWKTFREDLPWLNKSHRMLVAIASGILGRLIAGEDLNAAEMNLLRQCIGSMGGTPSDASKVSVPDQDEPDDPSAKYFS
jgi:hypothetical protein